MSYVDKINFSVQACREQMPDPWLLADAIIAAVDNLVELAGQRHSATAAQSPAGSKAPARRKPRGTKRSGVKVKAKAKTKTKTGTKTQHRSGAAIQRKAPTRAKAVKQATLRSARAGAKKPKASA
jgi:hypothetical protein